MSEYAVTITETLKMTVRIEADSGEEAVYLAERKWRKADYILDAECFDGVEFTAAEKGCYYDKNT